MRNKLNFRNFCIIFLLVCVCGCGTWTRLREPDYYDDGREFKATVPVGWMRFNTIKYFLITRDGVILDVITVERFKPENDLEFTKKKFSLNMTIQDLAEVEIDNFQSNANIHSFKVIANQPVSIDSQPAFRLEYAYKTQGGLKMKGVSCGFLYADYFYRIRFEAAEQHYYADTVKEFDQFLNSLQLTFKRAYPQS